MSGADEQKDSQAAAPAPLADQMVSPSTVIPVNGDQPAAGAADVEAPPPAAPAETKAEPPPAAPAADKYVTVTYFDIFKQFVLLGWTAFGGPAAHIGLFQKVFVDRLRWLSTDVFAELFALGQCLPGPTSTQVRH